MSNSQLAPDRLAALHRPLAIAALGCVVVAVAVLASRPGVQARTGAPMPPSRAAADPAVDYRDATAVCVAFARALHARDTVTDTGPGDAYRRAAVYADARYAAAVADQPAVQLPDWQQWVDHRARIGVDAQPLAGDVDVDQADRQVRAVAVTATAKGRDEWTGPAVHTQVTCDLSPDRQGWRVSSYTVEVTR